MIYRTIFVLILAAPGGASGFESLPKQRDEAVAVFCGVEGTPIVRVNADGLVQWNNEKTTRLPTEKSEVIDYVWVETHASGLYVAYEATDWKLDGSSGAVCKFVAPATTPSWCTHIPAFNLVAAITETSALYVAGIGLAARIDLSTGKTLWKIDGLYERDSAFNIFRIPVEQGENVTFYASAMTGAPFKRLVVNRDSGVVKLLEAAPNASEVSRPFPRLINGCSQ